MAEFDSADDIIDFIDFEKLREQKEAMLRVMGELTTVNDSLVKNAKISKDLQDAQGIINLIDHIQDYAVDVLGKDEKEVFNFENIYCTIPSSLVIAYALAIATSGKASRILMAGFDGYGADDPRTFEMQNLISAYKSNPAALPITAVTPNNYSLPTQSIYAL